MGTGGAEIGSHVTIDALQRRDPGFECQAAPEKKNTFLFHSPAQGISGIYLYLKYGAGAVKFISFYIFHDINQGK